MEQLSGMMNSFNANVVPFLPRLVAALLIVGAAWLGAWVLRAFIVRVGRMARLEERTHVTGISVSLARIASALVWLFALPALLSTLGLDGLLVPVNAMMSKMLGFLPNILGAAVIMVVGIVIGRVVAQLVTELLKAVGSEQLASRIGLTQALGEKTLAGLVGSVVYAFILLPTLAASLQSLGLDAVTQPVSRLLDTVVNLIPRLISASLIILVFTLLGRTLASLTNTFLASLGFDAIPKHLGLSRHTLSGRTASDWVGSVVMFALVLVGIAQASEILGFALLTQVVTTVGGSLSDLIVAALILMVGLWIGAMCFRVLDQAHIIHSRVVARVAQVAILFFATALALRQAGLPPEIISIAFGSVVIGLSFGIALALGLGGKSVAERTLTKLEKSFERRHLQPTPPSTAASTLGEQASSSDDDATNVSSSTTHRL